MTLIELLAAARLTVAVAESLTGGTVCAELSREPGSSEVFLGGVVAYSVAAKERLLSVDRDLLAHAGPVDPKVAVAMAEGVARVTGADLAVATTGVAGPSPHGGRPPGEAYIGWWLRGRSGCLQVHAPGDRRQVITTVSNVTLDLVRDLADAGVPRATAAGVVIVT